MSVVAPSRRVRQPYLGVRHQPPAPPVVDEHEEDQRTEHLSLDDDPVTNPPVRGSKFAWIKLVLIAMLIVVVAWSVMVAFLTLADLCNDLKNTYQYGPTRTSVVSGVFFDHDSPTNQTQVVAINLHGTLLVEVIPDGDIAKTKVYSTGLKLVGASAAKTPLLLTIRDLNGDRKPDVLIDIAGQPLKLINTGSDFTVEK